MKDSGKKVLVTFRFLLCQIIMMIVYFKITI